MAFPMLMLASAAISAGGALMAGSAAKQASELDAFNIETDAELGKAQASQMAQARIAEYEMATSSNIAAFSAAGRDIGGDRSVKAFLDAQKEILGTDIGRMQNQSNMEALKMQQAAMSERQSGRAAQQASLFQAGSAVTSGLFNYYQAKT